MCIASKCFGQEVDVLGEGLNIAFSSVSDDSRCPEGVACIVEGNAKIKLFMTPTGYTSTIIELNTSPLAGSTETTYLTYNIKLTSLAPNNISGQAINQSDYLASLLITKN